MVENVAKVGRNEKKYQFIELRAAGVSLRNISKEMNISRRTIEQWNHELADAVKRAQDGRVSELIEAYKMDKEARVRRLGETIKKMDAAIAKIDYSQIDSAKLLQLRLTYMDALKAEAGETDAVDDLTRAEVNELKAKAQAGMATVREAELAATAAARLAESDAAMKKATMDSVFGFLG